MTQYFKETVTKLDKGFNEELLKFICQLKLINPEMLIGIFIPTDVKVVQACKYSNTINKLKHTV